MEKKTEKDFYSTRLERFGLWESPAEFTLDQAMKRMYGHLFCLIAETKRLGQGPQAIVIEIPEIVYAKESSPLAILSKASSIIDTVSIAAMFYTCAMSQAIDVATIKPRDWQGGKGRPRKVSSKAWSLMAANDILARSGRQDKLGTVKDENIADAITMGAMTIPAIFSQKVLFC